MVVARLRRRRQRGAGFQRKFRTRQPIKLYSVEVAAPRPNTCLADAELHRAHRVVCVFRRTRRRGRGRSAGLGLLKMSAGGGGLCCETVFVLAARSSIPTFFSSRLTRWGRLSNSMLRALRVLRGELDRSAARRTVWPDRFTTKDAKSTKGRVGSRRAKRLTPSFNLALLKLMSKPILCPRRDSSHEPAVAEDAPPVSARNNSGIPETFYRHDVCAAFAWQVMSILGGEVDAVRFVGQPNGNNRDGGH